MLDVLERHWPRLASSQTVNGQARLKMTLVLADRVQFQAEKVSVMALYFRCWLISACLLAFSERPRLGRERTRPSARRLYPHLRVIVENHELGGTAIRRQDTLQEDKSPCSSRDRHRQQPACTAGLRLLPLGPLVRTKGFRRRGVACPPCNTTCLAIICR